MKLGGLAWLVVLIVVNATAAQEPTPAAEPQTGPAQDEQQSTSEDDSGRTALNLLGEVASDEGEGRRNENVRITLIDNNVLRELTTRMGTTATVPVDIRIDQRYFAAEFGQPPKRLKQATLAPAP